MEKKDKNIKKTIARIIYILCWISIILVGIIIIAESVNIFINSTDEGLYWFWGLLVFIFIPPYNLITIAIIGMIIYIFFYNLKIRYEKNIENIVKQKEN